MEIPLAWKVQSVVGRVPVGSPVSTMDAIAASGVKDAGGTLKKMDCLERTHHGGVGGYGGSRDPDVYTRRKLPGKICEECPFERSQSAGCVISRPQMGEQFNLNQVMATPSA